MNGRPEITVLMSAYNAEKYLREAVDSVLCQTFTDFELLVFDDASRDETPRILAAYADPRLVLVRNETNLGLTRNLARGMEMARGEFVARLDADDVCMPTRLERQLVFMRANPDVGLAGCSAIFFGEGRNDFLVRHPAEHEEIKCRLLFGFCLLHPTAILRREAFASRGLNYDPHFTCSQDHDLWVRASRVMRLACIDEPLVRMREHGEKIGSTRKDVQIRLSDEIRGRQLSELGMAPPENELRVFNSVAAGGLPRSTAELNAFEAILCRLVEANEKKALFDPRALHQEVGSAFFGVCRSLLLSHDRLGRRYWRSPLRCYNRATMRAFMGMLWRSAIG